LRLLLGSTVISAGTRHTFPFRSQFGCGFSSSPHSMTGRLVFFDHSGTRVERTVGARLGLGPI
jgi:hypothetical protein